MRYYRFSIDEYQIETNQIPIQAVIVSNNRFWIKVGGVWKETVAWIKVSGVWKQATPYLKIGGIWK